MIPAKDATGEKPLGGVFQSWVLIPALTLIQSHQFQAISLLQQEAGPGGVSQALSTAAFSCSVSMGWARKGSLSWRGGWGLLWMDQQGWKAGGRCFCCSACLPGMTLAQEPIKPPSLPRAQRLRVCCLPPSAAGSWLSLSLASSLPPPPPPRLYPPPWATDFSVSAALFIKKQDDSLLMRF